LSVISGAVFPKSKPCTFTERISLGRLMCWKRSCTNARIFSARASPSGPEVSVSQLISTDILRGWRLRFDESVWSRWKMCLGGGLARRGRLEDFAPPLSPSFFHDNHILSNIAYPLKNMFVQPLTRASRMSCSSIHLAAYNILQAT
jgi:hypothetical protein